MVVDADGRLHPDAPRFVAPHFADPSVGGVQSLRAHLQPRAGADLASGRRVRGLRIPLPGRPNAWGTAGMGGNGQFNRLSALDAVADHEGRGATG